MKIEDYKASKVYVDWNFFNKTRKLHSIQIRELFVMLQRVRGSSKVFRLDFVAKTCIDCFKNNLLSQLTFALRSLQINAMQFQLTIAGDTHTHTHRVLCDCVDSAWGSRQSIELEINPKFSLLRRSRLSWVQFRNLLRPGFVHMAS